MTWPASTAVTRVIGRKMRRRGGTSTTRPRTRGGCAVDPQRDHDVADPPDLVTVGVEHGDSGQARDEDLRRSAHGPQG